ncbi:MAG: hypothetical protein AABZ47_06180 [Planctomycetota bacterium]
MTRPTLEVRQQSTRRFETADEQVVLAASAGLLQDLGFNIDESETDLGLIVASKDRSAVQGGQVAGKVFMLILFRANVPIDKNQRFRASIVTKPVGQDIVVRVTFQRVVWNDRGQITHLERLDEPGAYQEFFDKLSKSIFLQAHE